ncbi:hypothetical protein ONZ45_g6522 [Pleurotus djamor]|nr:hypothetical protein ONZ45_g6522 [Pleurotus djamor]
MHGSKLTGEANTAAGKFQKEVTAKTNDAVAEGQHDVEAAKAAGAGYVEQAMEMAGNVLATAQTYLPPSLGGPTQHSGDDQNKSVVESASTTAANMAASVQSGASTIVDAAKDFLASSNNVSIQDSAQPHINKARELAGRVIEGAGAGPDVAPPASSTGIPATSAPLESGPHTMSTPYPSTTTTVGSGVKIAEIEKKDV